MIRKNIKNQDAQIDELKREVEGQTRLGEANAVLKLLKKRTELKRSVTRSRWVSKTLKSYRLIHVGIGQLTFVTLLVHILHALKVFG